MCVLGEIGESGDVDIFERREGVRNRRDILRE